MRVQHTTPEISDKRTYTVDEIAEILDVGKNAAYELVKQGLFRSVRIGAIIRVSKKSFDEWLDCHYNNLEGDS